MATDTGRWGTVGVRASPVNRRAPLKMSAAWLTVLATVLLSDVPLAPALDVAVPSVMAGSPGQFGSDLDLTAEHVLIPDTIVGESHKIHIRVQKRKWLDIDIRVESETGAFIASGHDCRRPKEICTIEVSFLPSSPGRHAASVLLSALPYGYINAVQLEADAMSSGAVAERRRSAAQLPRHVVKP